MSLDLAVLVLATVAGLAAVIVVFGPDRPRRERRAVDADLIPRFLGALGLGALVLTFSGWLVASTVVAVGGWFATGRWHRRAG